MAIRTWLKLLAATLATAALAGTSQLGLAYGLGILRLARVLDVTARDEWTAQVAWATWIAMMSAVAGALVGGRLLTRWATIPPGGTAIVALAVTAALGATIVAPLTMQPARAAQVSGVQPAFIIGVCAALGALVGAVAAGAAVRSPVARRSLVVTGSTMWALALGSALPSFRPAQPLPSVRLGVVDAGVLSPAMLQLFALLTMPVLALAAGALLGWQARREARALWDVALSGLAGPALLTSAYLIAGPAPGPANYQVVPYWAAMTATGAGVLGSVLLAVLRRDTPEPTPEAAAPEAAAPEAAEAPEPTAAAAPPSALPPLPAVAAATVPFPSSAVAAFPQREPTAVPTPFPTPQADSLPQGEPTGFPRREPTGIQRREPTALDDPQPQGRTRWWGEQDNGTPDYGDTWRTGGDVESSVHHTTALDATDHSGWPVREETLGQAAAETDPTWQSEPSWNQDSWRSRRYDDFTDRVGGRGGE